MIILFLDASDSALPLMSEAIFNHYAPEGFEAISAVAEMAAAPHLGALALLERHGMPTAGSFSQSWHELQQVPDVLVSLSSSIDTVNCPLNLRSVFHAHWGDHDALNADGAEAMEALLDDTFKILQTRIQAFLALPHDQLLNNPERLAAALSELVTQTSQGNIGSDASLALA